MYTNRRVSCSMFLAFYLSAFRSSCKTIIEKGVGSYSILFYQNPTKVVVLYFLLTATAAVRFITPNPPRQAGGVFPPGPPPPPPSGGPPPTGPRGPPPPPPNRTASAAAGGSGVGQGGGQLSGAGHLPMQHADLPPMQTLTQVGVN